jgi:hypothetical protein
MRPNRRNAESYLSLLRFLLFNLRYPRALAACSRTCWMWTSTCLRKEGETA